MNSEETEKIGVRGEYASPNRSDKWKPVWQALLIGVIASGLLIGAETIFPTSISCVSLFPVGWP